jgi:hypothetical protein
MPVIQPLSRHPECPGGSPAYLHIRAVSVPARSTGIVVARSQPRARP